MWPMVPTFTCGLLRSNFSLAMSAILALRSCDGADVQDRTGDLVLTKDALCQLSYIGKQSQSFSLSVSVWSGRRGSNPRPTAWKAVTLPLSYSRLRPLTLCCSLRSLARQPKRLRSVHPETLRRRAEVGGEGRTRTFEATWATDLQSAAFDRFATSPVICVWNQCVDAFLRTGCTL